MSLAKWLKENSPIPYEIMNNALRNNKVSHAYLFSAQKNQTIKEEYEYLVQKILKKDNDFNIQNYSDLIFIDGSKELIRKEQVINAITKMQETSLDASGIKILIIINIENSNAHSLNSLLKFIEEPTKKTYIIMTTNRLSSVLPTIRSRSQIVNVHPIDRKVWADSIEKMGIKYKYKFILSEIKNSKKEIENINKASFKNNYENVVNILQKSLDNKENIVIELKKYVKKDNYLNVFGLIKIFYSDIWKIKRLINISFIDEKSLIKLYEESKFNYKKAIHDINEFFISIEMNANFELSKSNLLIELKKCY